MKLDGTVLEYLPYFRKDTGRRVTVHHLLCHTHGIPYVSYNKLPYRNKLSKEDFFREYYSGDLEFEPGKGFKYSDGFDILAAIVEVVSGKPFEALMQERIFDPLEMKDSGFYHVKRNIQRHATDYADSIDVKSEALYELPLNGSSALYSTVDDLFRWDRALAENRLLSRRFQDMMFSVQADFGRPYGYGYDIAELDFGRQKKKMAWHEGSGSAIIFRSLEDGNLVILSNTISSGRELPGRPGDHEYPVRPSLPGRRATGRIGAAASKEVEAGEERYFSAFSCRIWIFHRGKMFPMIVSLQHSRACFRLIYLKQ